MTMTKKLLELLVKNAGVSWLAPTKLFLVTEGKCIEGTIITRFDYMKSDIRMVTERMTRDEISTLQVRMAFEAELRDLMSTERDELERIYLADVIVDGKPVTRISIPMEKVEIFSFPGEPPQSSVKISPRS
jgi:hypothetical protein